MFLNLQKNISCLCIFLIVQLFLSTILLLILVSGEYQKNPRNPFTEALHIIENINNNPESTWKAGKNFDPDLSPSYINLLLGLKLKPEPEFILPVLNIISVNNEEIPESFDARKKWNYCKSLHEIKDQGGCGSCWAVAAASAFTDRLCIASKGDFNGSLSSRELLSCCKECGDGCRGGYTDAAWNYLMFHGIVTGGDYNSSQGCQPYSLQPCEHHVSGPRPKCPSLQFVGTPRCETACTNKDYKTPFDEDHHKVSSSFILPNNVRVIQKQILMHGPVEAGYLVFSDFLSYKSGVYQPTPGISPVGGHAVKVIGWGEENNIPYWLVQNSWNVDWGDHGLFKILRGNNTCGFESNVVAGIP